MQTLRHCGLMALAAGLGLALAPAHAQQPGNPFFNANVPVNGNVPSVPFSYYNNNPNSGSGYNPGSYPYSPYNGPDPYGGYLSGSANVINAQGQYLMNTQQAYLLQEQARQNKLDTRRKAYDEWLYERANTPSLNDQREKSQQDELRRSLNNPPITEIWSGKSLNDLLTSVQNMTSKGYEGPPVPISPDLLRNINLTTAAGPGNSGVLKEAGKSNWPYALEILQPADQTKQQRNQVDALMAEAKSQAATKGKVDASLLTELNGTIYSLRNNLVANVSDYSPTDYIAAKRFLSELDDAVKTLKTPSARNYLNGAYAARGNTVRELVQNMTREGLIFAPAVAGEEPSYTSLHSSMVQYTMPGFAQYSQPPPPKQ